jgi:CheY-like chemotaxis protein
MGRSLRPLFAREYAHSFDEAQKALRSAGVPAAASQPHTADGATHEDHGWAASDGSKMRVLVVDGDADGAQSIATRLRMHGYEARVALDGPSALGAVEDGQPDVVLLDIGLPGIEGYEVARRVREKARGRNPFIIAVTGHGRDEDLRRCSEVGIDLHLQKPVDFECLQTLLKRFEGIVLPAP